MMAGDELNSVSVRAKHLYLLDILRGLASLSVVIWHYQHFFFQGTTGWLPEDFDRKSQPFYQSLSLFYEEGSRAVYLFFVLSGFIFFFQYAEAVRTRAVSARTFFVLRFSRLYPLHAVTLVIVAVGQTVAVAMTNNFIVYQCNNVKRFALSALFLTDWIPKKYICGTFNGPVWSLSVEVFLYVLFFAFALILPARWAWQFCYTALVVVASVCIYLADGYHLIGEPAVCFFMGGIAFLIWSKLPASALSGISLSIVCASACASVFYLMHLTEIRPLLLDVVAFPFLVLTLVCLQNVYHNAGNAFRIIGDITYSTYLLHFPITMVLILAGTAGIIAVDFHSEAAWLTYAILVITFSICSFYLFERPSQTYIRKLLLHKRGAPTAHQNTITAFPKPDLM